MASNSSPRGNDANYNRPSNGSAYRQPNFYAHTGGDTINNHPTHPIGPNGNIYTSLPTMADKGRLSEQQKKENHIASEQKRRQAIREGFDMLSRIVPGMEGQGRSEAVVLQASVEFLKKQMMLKDQLWNVARANGTSKEEFEKYYRDGGKAIKEQEEYTQHPGGGYYPKHNS